MRAELMAINKVVETFRKERKEKKKCKNKVIDQPTSFGAFLFQKKDCENSVVIYRHLKYQKGQRVN